MECLRCRGSQIWVRAKRVMRAIGPLHAELARWPGVQRRSRRGCSADERSADRVTELLDALSLATEELGVAYGPQAGQREVAAAVADWLLLGTRSPTLNGEAIRAAAGQSGTDRRWAWVLGQTYRDRQREAIA